MTTRAELSSLTATLEEVNRRVTDLAERSRQGGEAEAAAELFAVERALGGALRRMRRLSAKLVD